MTRQSLPQSLSAARLRLLASGADLNRDSHPPDQPTGSSHANKRTILGLLQAPAFDTLGGSIVTATAAGAAASSANKAL